MIASMIARAAFAISRESSRFTLDAAHMEIGERVRPVATDSHRLALVETAGEGKWKIETALLPRKAALQLARLAAEEPGVDIRVARDDNHLFFGVGERVMAARLSSGNFPDYTRISPLDHPHRIALFRAPLMEAIERVAQFSEDRSRCIFLAFTTDALELRSAATGIGESQEGILIDYRGPAIEIGFNADYLLDFLGVATEETVYLLLKDAQAAGELRSADDSYRYVVTPMRG